MKERGLGNNKAVVDDAYMKEHEDINSRREKFSLMIDV